VRNDRRKDKRCGIKKYPFHVYMLEKLITQYLHDTPFIFRCQTAKIQKKHPTFSEKHSTSGESKASFADRRYAVTLRQFAV
jgi:hypothetical protein